MGNLIGVMAQKPTNLISVMALGSKPNKRNEAKFFKLQGQPNKRNGSKASPLLLLGLLEYVAQLALRYGAQT